MSKTNNEADVLAHLQSLDQCGYDILQILEAHFTEPILIDKELEEYFERWLIEMKNLVLKEREIIDFGDISNMPNKHVLSISSGDPKKDMREATAFLNLFLSEVRSMRRGLGAITSHTGIRNEKLKEYLEGVYRRKGVSSKLFTRPPVAQKVMITISFDNKKGFYRNDNPALAYPIGLATKRLKFIKLLHKSTQSVPISTIKSKIGYKSKIKQNENALVIKEVKGINKLFREKLKVESDFIISIGTGGYSLNQEKFFIQNL